jgi:hypothetical protein
LPSIQSSPATNRGANCPASGARKPAAFRPFDAPSFLSKQGVIAP